MRSPSLVKDLCLAMRDGAGDATPITVKCRIGVDNDDSYEQLAAFVEEVGGRGLLSVHALLPCDALEILAKGFRLARGPGLRMFCPTEITLSPHVRFILSVEVGLIQSMIDLERVIEPTLP